MFNNVSYIDEIKKIEKAINYLDEEAEENNKIIRMRLLRMLNNLEKIADDMADYINGSWNNTTLDYLKQRNTVYLNNNDYLSYLSGLKDLQYMDQIMLVCKAQTIDEKMYFISEYAKYKNRKEIKGNKKVR